MACLGRIWVDFKAKAWEASEPIILFVALCSSWKLVVGEGLELAMVERTPPVQECRCEVRTHGRNIGGRGGQ